MNSDTPGLNGGNHGADLPLDDNDVDSEGIYDPGDTLNRGMGIACLLVLIFFALVSCGFIISVLSVHR